MSVDLDALLTMSYGLYLVTSRKGERLNGQVSNAVMQVTDSPPRLAVAINRSELTHEFIESSGVFAVTVLDEETPMELIGLFGFKSGRDVDKLARVSYSTGVTGCALVREHALACLEARVTGRLEAGSHTIFLGEVADAQILGRGRPMTYAYYREVLRGKTPPTAPTYRAPGASVERPLGGAGAREEGNAVATAKKYVCDVCGYIYDPEKGDPTSGVAPGTPFEKLPPDWVCPVCGAGKDQFSPAD